MAQEIIEQLLKEVKKPLSRSEIAEKLKLDPISVSHNLKRMMKYNCIKIIEIDRFKAKELYNCTRRIRLYYI